jgi:N-acetyl-gamma-glutamyl-phosphate reductase
MDLRMTDASSSQIPLTNRQRTAILGASGYTGAELLRLARRHPAIEIRALSADRQAGREMEEVFPHLGLDHLPQLTRIEEIPFDEMDVVFCALPHATTQAVVRGLPERLRVIDLSADFRLAKGELYEEWYGHPHGALELQGQAVYGLTEMHRTAISMARLVANPGCYPTATLLPLLPLVRDRMIEMDEIVVDAKSGVSGAGRSEKLGNLFAEVAEGMHAYGVGRHRHMPEIEQELSAASGQPVTISFTPHLIPINRGMLATTYVRLKPGIDFMEARNALEDAYASEPFVHVLKPGVVPSSRHVRGTNHCLINIVQDRRPGCVILLSAIDNLMKGASGQAIQNFNVMHRLDEITGLDEGALFP